jgi:hypothetical protein
VNNVNCQSLTKKVKAADKSETQSDKENKNNKKYGQLLGQSIFSVFMKLTIFSDKNGLSEKVNFL